jgi:hypothetical protein
VLITVEAGLLKQADALARRKVSRSELIAASLASALAQAKAA